MKVIVGLPWRLDWETTGLARRIKECFQTLAGLDVSINLYCLGPSFKEKNLFVQSISSLKFPRDNMFSPLLNSLAFSFRFAEKVKRKRFDILHCFNTTSLFLSNKKYLFQTVNPTYAFISEILEEEYPKTGKFQRRINYCKTVANLEKIEYENAEQIIASSWLIKNNIVKYHKVDKNKIKVIPAGVQPNGSKKRTITKKDFKLIVFPGSISVMKGFKYLCEAMEIIRKSFPNIILLVAGKINQFEFEIFKDFIKKLKSKKILVLTGFVPREKLHTYFMMADVCCIPSLYDDMNISLLEALTYGLPVVATPNTGFSEISKVGIEVPPKNSEAIAKAIISLLSDEKLWIKKSREAKKVIKNYYWTEIAKKFLKTYKRL